MKKLLPPEELARDARFNRAYLADRFNDKRVAKRGEDRVGGGSYGGGSRQVRLTPDLPGASDQARSLMHGIFVGEVQALEGAGRTCWDFEVGPGEDKVPFELKLDMARQCWDESRHCEISVKLSEWMGTELGEFVESTFLYEAACNPDPVLRLTGVNRALEGLALDEFNTMREFGRIAGDPVLEFCEDWMLADEVTHVKMGSTWLRAVTEGDPDRRSRALEFQRTVDSLFNFRGLRGEGQEASIRLARRFREMAGFSTDEIDEIAEMADRDRAARQAEGAPA